MKIAIAGPGRSGTTLLVKLLGGWGFSVPDEEENWNEIASAGLESKLGTDSRFEVDKDPWAYQYLETLSDEQISKYSVLIVPIRDLQQAAMSRSVLDRASRKDDGEHQFWSWGDWGTIPGGGVYSASVEEQQRILTLGLWRLLNAAASKNLKVVIIGFPKFAQDFDYLWSHMSPYVEERVTKDKAREVFKSIVDTARINKSQGMQPEITLAEAISLLKIKSSSISSLTNELQLLRIDLEKSAIELQKVRNSLSWRITLPMRKIKVFFSKMGKQN
jgi:hypothetical protein